MRLLLKRVNFMFCLSAAVLIIILLSSCSSRTDSNSTGTIGSAGNDMEETAVEQKNSPVISTVRMEKNTAGQYEVLEIEVKFTADFKNPFDPEEIALDGIFTTPSGQEIIRPGFVSRVYPEARLESWSGAPIDGSIVLDGSEKWLIRFAAGEIGKYKFKVRVSDKNGTQLADGPEFDITASDNPGPIQVSKENPYYFQYRDSKKDFIPIGYNLPWSWPESMSDYRRLVTAMAANGGNYTRVWASGISQTLHLESMGLGMGWYRMDHAAITDVLFNLFRQNNIKVGYCIESFNSLQQDPKWYGEWQNSPYNSANGGPLEYPGEYWTNEEAKKYFKQKIRYIMGRWGCDTTIAQWELWNEVDGTNGFNQKKVADWHKEMAQYVKVLDPYKRPVSTSFAHYGGNDMRIHSLDEIDITTIHFYGSEDFAKTMQDVVANYKTAYKKPVLVGEFGLLPENFDKDPQGISMHNGIWGGLLSGSVGTPQLWWWDEYIYPNELYRMLQPVRGFADQFSFSNAPLILINKFVEVPEEVRVMGLKADSSDRGVMWLQDLKHTWSIQYKNKDAGYKPLKNITVKVTGLKDGKYRVVIWDTWEGKALDELALASDGGIFEFTLPELNRDVAVLFEKVES